MELKGLKKFRLKEVLNLKSHLLQQFKLLLSTICEISNSTTISTRRYLFTSSLYCYTTLQKSNFLDYFLFLSIFLVSYHNIISTFRGSQWSFSTEPFAFTQGPIQLSNGVHLNSLLLTHINT